MEQAFSNSVQQTDMLKGTTFRILLFHCLMPQHVTDAHRLPCITPIDADRSLNITDTNTTPALF